MQDQRCRSVHQLAANLKFSGPLPRSMQCRNLNCKPYTNVVDLVDWVRSNHLHPPNFPGVECGYKKERFECPPSHGLFRVGRGSGKMLIMLRTMLRRCVRVILVFKNHFRVTFDDLPLGRKNTSLVTDILSKDGHERIENLVRIAAEHRGIEKQRTLDRELTSTGYWLVVEQVTDEAESGNTSCNFCSEMTHFRVRVRVELDLRAIPTPCPSSLVCASPYGTISSC